MIFSQTIERYQLLHEQNVNLKIDFALEIIDDKHELININGG